MVLRFLTKKTQILSKFFGKKLAYKIFSCAKKLRNKKQKNHDELYLHDELQKYDQFIDFNQTFDLNKYSKKVNYLYLNDFHDENLAKYVKNNISNFFLYTAGGIVPKSFLSIEGLKVLHIHPGVVPHIKGSDGLFWSVLIRNKPGASCFYMNAGIDTGSIIHTQEYKLPKFMFNNINSTTHKYNALLKYYDPHTRAKVLVEVLKKTKNLTAIKTKEQSPEDGRTYFAMHKNLIEKVLGKISC
jgi:methionyl-tRNA formyltransferase